MMSVKVLVGKNTFVLVRCHKLLNVEFQNTIIQSEKWSYTNMQVATSCNNIGLIYIEHLRICMHLHWNGFNQPTKMRKTIYGANTNHKNMHAAACYSNIEVAYEY